MNDNKSIEPMDPVQGVFDFLIAGHGNANILEYLETREVTPAQAKDILEEALTKFLKSAALPKSLRRGWCLEAYRELYRKLVETGDYSGALKAINEIAKLSDLLSSKGKTPDENIKDEIDEYIENMMAIRG